MSYVVPSVLVYQQLASNGGVANVTPDLESCIIGPCYNVVEYGSTAADLVRTAATLDDGSPAIIPNRTTNNLDVNLPSQKPGQLVDPDSLIVYLNEAEIETKSSYFQHTLGTNSFTVRNLFMTAAATAGTNQITVAFSGNTIFPNDNITLDGAGPGGAQYQGRVLSRSGAVLTVTPNISTTVSAGQMGRSTFANLNLSTSTLRVEPGDKAVLTDEVGTQMVSTVMSVRSVSNNVDRVILADTTPLTLTLPVTIKFSKVLNNVMVPKLFDGLDNYTTDALVSQGKVRILNFLETAYGTVDYAKVYTEYVALRQDLSTSVLDINNVDEVEGVLGVISDRNPLALAVQLALANTTSRIRAIALKSNDLTGYLDALDLSESTRLHTIVPLTQEESILAAVQQHTEQMSTPENANWRQAIVNTKTPDVTYIGQYNPDLVNNNGGNNTVSLIGSSYTLTSSNSTFVSDGVSPGDTLRITSHTAIPGVTIRSVKILSVVANQQLILDTTQALTGVRFYIERTLSRTQQATHVAAVSSTFSSSRVVHVQPDVCGVIVGGNTKYLPGYYLCAAMSGLTAGLPAQQGLTNIGLAGIADLSRSNFYYTRAQLNTMAEAGTCLLVQEAAGTIPYVRHSLTTDMTVLQYREVQQVRNIDFLSYFFHDILKGFVGRYNITPDTLQIIRTTINSGGKLLQSKKLPKIGPPLLEFTIKTLKQDENNKDHVIVELPVTFPTVMNYIDLYLIV